MSYINQEDGVRHASAGEHYHVSGYVYVKLFVSFDTGYDSSEAGFDSDLEEAVADVISDDYEIEDTGDLEWEIVEDEWDE